MGRHAVFSRTGRLCILLSNRISLVSLRLGNQMQGTSYFRKRVQQGLKENGCSAAFRECMLYQYTRIKFNVGYCVFSNMY